MHRLSSEQWATPVPLPGWDVRSAFVHIVGAEAMLLGRRPTADVDADAIAHVHNPIGAANEAWIASYADATAPRLIAEYRAVTTARLEAIDAMSSEEWDAVGLTPAGQAPYARFMQIRVFDCWMHEQDIRVALGRPGHEAGTAVEVALDEITLAQGFVVGKPAGTPVGSCVTFDLTGPAARHVHLAVGERATVVESLDAPPTVTLSMPVLSLTRLAGGRLDADGHRARCTVVGDEELGRAILENRAYTI